MNKYQIKLERIILDLRELEENISDSTAREKLYQVHRALEQIIIHDYDDE
jgi:hypothetical protein